MQSTLVQEGWSFLVVAHDEMCIATEGACTATKADAIAMVNELAHGKLSLAVVTGLPVSEESAALQVRVEPADGALAVRNRCSTKIGNRTHLDLMENEGLYARLHRSQFRTLTEPAASRDDR